MSVGYSNYIDVTQTNAAWLHYRAREWQQAQTRVEVVLETAVSAYEANDDVTARDCLETAVDLAAQHGYL